MQEQTPQDHKAPHEKPSPARISGQTLLRCCTTGIILLLVSILPLTVVAATSRPHALGEAPAFGNGTRSGKPQPLRPRTPANPRPNVARNSPVSGSVLTSTVANGNWTNLFPDLYAVSAVSSADAWAAGDYGHLLHFTAGTWRAVDPPELHGYHLTDIKMLSPTDGWIASGYHVFQYDGTTWRDRSPQQGSWIQVDHLAPVGDNDVWGIAGSGIVHWDGTRWNTSGPAFGEGTELFAITMANAKDGWILGIDHLGNGQIVLHYDGTRWAAVNGPPGVAYLNYIWAGPQGEAWMTGSDTAGVSRIYHYSGGAWSSWVTPDRTYLFGIYMLNATSGWVATELSILHWNGTAWTVEYTLAGPGIYQLSGQDGLVWAVGLADAAAYRQPDGSWVQQRGGPTIADLYGVSALSPADAWAVGTGGSIVHLMDNQWQVVPSPITRTLYAVQMLSVSDGVAVGDNALLHWDGHLWTRVATPPVTMNGVFMSAGGDGWAVGEQGTIWRAQEGVWAPVTSPVTATLAAVAMDSLNHGWVVGSQLYGTGQPILLEWDGRRWLDRRAELPDGTPALTALALQPGGAEGWAVGARGHAILHLLGGTWTPDTDNQAGNLTTVATEALGEAMAAGELIYHYSDGSWKDHDLRIPATFGMLEHIALVPGRGGWGVGQGGLILHYDPLAPGQRFYDVPLTNPFASYIEYMAAHNIVSGYADNTFHPYANITRGQLTKMVVSGMAWPPSNPASPTFADVPASYTFFSYVETAVSHGVIRGYSCGAPGEPCDLFNRPYFRPQNDVTRAQLAKIVVTAKGWGALQSPSPTFVDVPTGDPFYGYVEQAAAKGIVSGYTCGGPREPCPGLYFRPRAGATRSQFSKILYLALSQP